MSDGTFSNVEAQILEQVKATKYLGIIFTDHQDCVKATKTLGFFVSIVP